MRYREMTINGGAGADSAIVGSPTAVGGNTTAWNSHTQWTGVIAAVTAKLGAIVKEFGAVFTRAAYPSSGAAGRAGTDQTWYGVRRYLGS